MEAPSPRLLACRIILAICLGIGTANAIGWILDIPALVSLFDRLPKMVPITAALVLSCTASLWLQLDAPAWRRTASLLGALVCAAGVFMLACYLARHAPPPLLLSRPGDQSANSLSSPVTAGLFALLGTALVLLAHDRQVKTAQLAAMAVLLLSLLNLTGYFFQDTLLYAILPGKGVSLLTTVAAILIASAALLLRATQGIMVVVTAASPSARMARWLLLSALAIPLVLAAGAVSALHAGLYDAETLLPLLAWGTIVLLTLLIWRFAFRLYDADLARTRAQQDLQLALQHLGDERDRKDIFLATLAHELRNPLAPIRSAAELLRYLREPDARQIEKVSGTILRQVDHMTHLVDDLMDVSRIGRGQVVLESGPVAVQAVIADAYEQVRPIIERRRHSCSLDLLPGPVTVDGDHKRLVQVLANLLNNAAKYTPEGGVLALRLRATARQVEIAVLDNGAGMDAALVPRVFDTFTQAVVTPDRREGGLGLGLALVKRLTELHGGTVRAESAGPGHGSAFTVCLPRAQAEPALRGNVSA